MTHMTHMTKLIAHILETQAGISWVYVSHVSQWLNDLVDPPGQLRAAESSLTASVGPILSSQPICWTLMAQTQQALMAYQIPSGNLTVCY
jgi:hypothetical protein